MEENKKASGLAITALILGIVSLSFAVLVWIFGGIGKASYSSVCLGIAFTVGILGIFLGIASTVLAIMAKKAEDTSKLSTIALTLGMAGLALSGLNFISCLSCITCASYTSRSVTKSILNSIF